MEAIYKRTDALLPVPFGYCPGCLHGVAGKVIAEVVEEMGMIENAIAVNGVGCTSMAMSASSMDCISSLHGRAAATATGVKRMLPNALVFTNHGDGDCASIGIAETIYAANRGEAFTAIMFNNTVYGMTGAQMAPTTLIGQKTTTCIDGRDPATTGYPLKMAELIAGLEAPRYVARCAAHRPKHIIQLKKAIRHAFELQMNEGAYSFIEIVTGCPTGIHIKPEQMPDLIDEKVLPVFPLGVFKDV